MADSHAHAHGGGHEAAHGGGPPADEASWDERYRSADRIWSGEPNRQLVAELSGRQPGIALDAGCGEGADALWLARAGWTVVAADISGVALERAERHARAADAEAAARIQWLHVNLLERAPESESFDLVSAQFLQLEPPQRTQLFRALARAVRAGGMLLVVGHHPSDLGAAVRRPPVPERFYPPEEIAGLLGPSWSVRVCEARPRSVRTEEGAEVTIHDTVLAAVREDL